MNTSGQLQGSGAASLTCDLHNAANFVVWCESLSQTSTWELWTRLRLSKHFWFALEARNTNPAKLRISVSPWDINAVKSKNLCSWRTVGANKSWIQRKSRLETVGRSSLDPSSNTHSQDAFKQRSWVVALLLSVVHPCTGDLC